MADRIRLRRDTAANWASANPVLLLGEGGWETDTGKLKVGDGTLAWNALEYAAKSFIWKGAYSGSTAYKKNDVVSYGGQSYICILDSTNVLPTVTASWSLMVAKGSDGTNGTNGVSFVWKGTYSNSTTYVVRDCVYYNGSAYICTQASTAILPTTTTHWDLLSAGGIDGADGSNGVNGAAATISVGATTTGAAGSSATVTNSGTSSAAVFNFTVPRGDKGDKGDTGATGSVTVVAGTTSTVFTATANQSVFAPINGYTTTDAGAYLVSVGAQDQIPTVNYTITSANGGSLVLSAGVAAGTVVSIRAIVGVAASGNATQLQGRAISTTAPTNFAQALIWSISRNNWEPGRADAQWLWGRGVAGTLPTNGQALVWDSVGQIWRPTTVSGGDGNATQLQGYDVSSTAPALGQILQWSGSAWTPFTLNLHGTITYSTPGTYNFKLPVGVGTQLWVQVNASAGAGTDGTNGSDGTLEGNGADGVDGEAGGDVSLFGMTLLGGAGGLKGWGGGAPGQAGNGPEAGQPANGILGGAPDGQDGNYAPNEFETAPGGLGGGGGGLGSGGDGAEFFNNGVGGNSGGGGGSGANGSGGGGGGQNSQGVIGQPGKGGAGQSGQAGETYSGAIQISENTNYQIVVGTRGSVTITW